MTNIVIGSVELKINGRRLRAYKASGQTVEKAAELLVTAAAGKGYEDSILDRVALLSADGGLGHQAVRKALGLDQPKSAGGPVQKPDSPAVKEASDKLKQAKGDREKVVAKTNEAAAEAASVAADAVRAGASGDLNEADKAVAESVANLNVARAEQHLDRSRSVAGSAAEPASATIGLRRAAMPPRKTTTTTKAGDQDASEK